MGGVSSCLLRKRSKRDNLTVMSSTDWHNDDIDRIFEAVTASIFEAAPIDGVVSAIKAADAASVWPDVVLEDVLDTEYLED